MEKTMRLENKKALVTGASRGIGRAIAERFVSEGASVWGVSSKEPADLADFQARAGGKVQWKCLDLSQLDALESEIDGLEKSSGGFDILVNDAGITRDNLTFRMSLEDWQKVLNVNLSAAFVICKAVGRGMLRRRHGAMLNMASVVGIHGNGGQANYAASKAGLIGLTKSLAAELASRNVRVNAVAPGYVSSDMTAVMPEAAKQFMLDHIPLKRAGEPTDIANAALFLCSDEASYITGQVLPVDGGMFF
jgi:3-oxoacyl-[acyl-carrier protein] reductase